MDLSKIKPAKPSLRGKFGGLEVGQSFVTSNGRGGFNLFVKQNDTEACKRGGAGRISFRESDTIGPIE